MRHFLFITLIAGSLMASEVIFFNPVSSPVPNKVTLREPSIDETPYLNATNALVITNRVTQVATGVTLSNLYLVCVVDGQQVRLYNQSDIDRIAASNAIWQAEAVISSSNALVRSKYDARVIATNIFNGTQVDGQELFIRSLGQATWYFINFTRTNDGKAALPTDTFTGKVKEFINAFGQ